MFQPLPSTFKDTSKKYTIIFKLYKTALFFPGFTHCVAG